MWFVADVRESLGGAHNAIELTSVTPVAFLATQTATPDEATSIRRFCLAGTYRSRRVCSASGRRAWQLLHQKPRWKLFPDLLNFFDHCEPIFYMYLLEWTLDVRSCVDRILPVPPSFW